MRQISLRELVDELGMATVARQLEISTPAVHKALAADRQITVSVTSDGKVEAAMETKPFPNKPRQAS